MRALFVSTAVAPLGSAAAGGVDRTIRNAARALRRRGHTVALVAPSGSAPVPEVDALIEVSGTAQPRAQRSAPDAVDPLPPGSVLEAMWDSVAELHLAADVVVNFSYDWLPLYLDTCAAIETPVVHHLTMGRESDLVARLARRLAARLPGSVATYTRAQASDHGLDDAVVLGFGLDLDLYPARLSGPGPRLAWAGRVAPEKQLGHAVTVAARTGLALDVCGAIEDPDELDEARRRHPGSVVEVHGLLGVEALAGVLGRARALLMTPRWAEALGIVALEALACGTPVLAYARGGIGEVVDEGVTGRVVDPDDIDGLCAAVTGLERLERADCRRAAERRFGLSAYGERLEAWLSGICGAGPCP